jgi:MFS family permease
MTTEKKLFLGSCFALITTALSFSLRAGILPQIQADLGLSGEQLGFINSMWFLGFPISMIIGGLIYHSVGGSRIMQFAFFAHAIGIIGTIYAGSYTGLLIASLLIGLGNGCTEAACNPMIADAYEGNRMSKMMNRFHMWFPGGIVIGSLLSLLMDSVNLTWQTQIWVILIPAIIYAYLFWGEKWPKAKTKAAESIKGSIQGMMTPLFIFIFFCMAITASSEFGTTQWVQLILSKSGASPMLVLALVTGLMAVARFFGGEMVAKFNMTGVLLGSAILATIGLYLFSTVTGGMVYVAAIFFGLGIAYFWPNMIGFVAKYIPKSGALGLSLVGAMGMFANVFMQPVFGAMIDSNKSKAIAEGITGEQLELVTGQNTLFTMMLFTASLIVLFTILYFWMKGKEAEGQVLVH